MLTSRQLRSDRIRVLRHRAMLVVLALVVVASGCRAPEDKAKAAEERAIEELRSSTTQAGDNPCGFTTPQEVDAVFGGPVAANLTESGTCAYTVRSGEVRFSVLRGQTRPLPELVPDSEPITDLGDAAAWSADGEQGGVLVVRLDETDAIFDLRLDQPPEQSLGKAVSWAQLVVPRVQEVASSSVGPSTTESSDDTADALCTLLPVETRKAVLGEGWEALPRQGDGLCRFRAGGGSDVEIGPQTQPATPATLEGITRTSELDGVPTPWPREELTQLGRAAVLLRDPGEVGRVEIYVVQGSTMLRVAVSSEDAEVARVLATVVSSEAIG